MKFDRNFEIESKTFVGQLVFEKVLPANKGAETANAEPPRGSVSRKAARSSDEKSKMPPMPFVLLFTLILLRTGNGVGGGGGG